MYIMKYNLTNIKYNSTSSSVGNINVYLKSSISINERGKSLCETRLNEAVLTNLMQQLCSMKDTFDT